MSFRDGKLKMLLTNTELEEVIIFKRVKYKYYENYLCNIIQPLPIHVYFTVAL